MKRLPLPSPSLSARALPPCARAMLRTIASPSPSPCAARTASCGSRWKRWNTRSSADAGMPDAAVGELDLEPARRDGAHVDLDVHLAARVAHRVVEQVAERDAELLRVAAHARRRRARTRARPPAAGRGARARRRRTRCEQRRERRSGARRARGESVRAAWMIWSIVLLQPMQVLGHDREELVAPLARGARARAACRGRAAATPAACAARESPGP